MRISIKIRFSIFLAVLLLLTLIILSSLVLEGIEKDQQKQYEEYLAQQAKTANLYFIQLILAESSKVPSNFLASKGEEFAEQLELIIGQSVVLYNQSGTIVSEKAPQNQSNDLKDALQFALDNKTAYQIENDSLYYMTPLKVGNEQVGVIQFYYSLSRNLEFYNHIKLLFIYIGTGVFILSFILAYFYFNSFANGIIMLEKMIYRIRKGHYETKVLTRKDEIGKLSEGIHEMSEQIMKTIQNMKKEQENLRLAVNKLSQLEKQQKQFIGNVTHEFKTPLTSVKAYIDLLEMYPDDEELLKTAKTNIKNETQRLYEMVEKVLELSSLEKYDFEFNKEKIDVKESILQVLNSLKGKMDKFGINLETELTKAYVEADKDSMIIILVNLMDNAIKYNKTRGNISVKSYVKDNQVIIEIADTGIGIPEKVVNKIFQPFFTVDKNRSRQNGGTGLGLALVKNQVEIQGGSISLVDTSSKGSTFRISFPLYKLSKTKK
ncbi:ATP-binding protein [Sporosalibacterium faouarense]|uniref:ATP-binding protein n=1 Tax=Sporosalibacterium faouarense TaxID=516123 RepID=UPI00192B58A0